MTSYIVTLLKCRCNVVLHSEKSNLLRLERVSSRVLFIFFKNSTKTSVSLKKKFFFSPPLKLYSTWYIYSTRYTSASYSTVNFVRTISRYTVYCRSSSDYRAKTRSPHEIIYNSKFYFPRIPSL